MDNAYGTTENALPEPSDVNHVLEIDEADIRLLLPYEGESDGRTLVGLGPVSRHGSAEKPETAPASLEPAALSLQPASLPPGAWSSGDEALPASMRGKKLGLWGVATPLLLVVAGVAVVVLRALGGSAPHSAAHDVAPLVERNQASLAVDVKGADVRVLLDGQDRGQPPLLLTGLAPGSHSLAILGSFYAPFEQPVTLVNDRVSTIVPKLELVHGSIDLPAGAEADGARVEVVGGGERRELTTLPLKLEAGPGEYQIRAKKAGFPPFETSVTLSAASPDIAVVVEFGKTAHGGAYRALTASSDDSTSPNDAPALNGTASTASGTGSLNITSSPPSSVVLDGRPLGKAPRIVDVPAGSHTVVFIHPKYGRQSVTVNTLPGRTTSASADF
jgi:hypothetical protein